MRLKKYFWFLIIPIFLVFTHSYAGNNNQVSSSVERDKKPYVVDVILPDGSKANEYKGVSSSTTPFFVARDLGASPESEDRLSAFPDIAMGMGGKITLYKAPNYTIFDGKRKIEAKSWTKTVQALLTEAHIPELGDDDKVTPPLASEIQSGATIKITRVAITHVTKVQEIEFQVVKKDDPNSDKGKVTVKQKGVKGSKSLTYEVRREDSGKGMMEVGRTLIKTEVIKTPTEEIQLVGTRPVITVRCKYNDTVLAAAMKYDYDPNKLCTLMMKESNGNPGSISGGGHKGLFQYTDGFWADASTKAGFKGADWNDPKAQIFTTAWALTHGYSGRW
ncbi:MAG TPA: G5 domain-containing protein [bacterium]|nr:G5 domain-containing protein [bacterium]